MSGSTIQDFLYRCKAGLEDAIGQYGLIIVIFLAIFGAFGLGRLSALENTASPVALKEAPTTNKALALPLGGEYVASRTGGSYYYPWCTGAQKITPENQVWFSSEQAARDAGYNPAKNCKGLVAN